MLSECYHLKSASENLKSKLLSSKTNGLFLTLFNTVIFLVLEKTISLVKTK